MKMKFYHPFLATLCLFLFSAGTTAQITFTNQNQLVPTDNFSGVAIGVTDVNGDNLDDIVRFSNASNLSVLYQNASGTGFTETNIGASGFGNQWTLSIADVDHNGYADMLTGGYTASQLDMTDVGGNSFSSTSLPGSFFAQGSNFVDINNDGFLDIFVCNDDGESYMYENDGTGFFTDANDWIDMAINGDPGEPSSGNYGSVWTDFDNDGDVDLYLAKCRLGVSSELDERRINKLFVNDGNNNYTEMGEEYGLRIGWQSWTAEFQDIDNDGDYDCFITNHDYPCQLLENDGTGHFTDITAGSGLVIGGIAIQGFMRDFDNDGFVDVLVAGTEQYLYKNNGDKTFTEVNAPFNNNDMESCAIGDLNNDGHLDIYAGYAQTYNNPSNIPDVLWMNDGNDNNWFKVHLVGTTSNLDGVGARIEIYGDWGVQVREVRSGEGYGITNSLIAHFGLGTATEIDNVIVKWPSGNIDVIENPTINELAEITEGDCLTAPGVITPSGNTVLCAGESLDLAAPDGTEYIWSTGATSQMITVNEAGNYSVLVGDGSGCFQSANIEVFVNPDETPTIIATGEMVFCTGQEVELVSSEASAYNWSTGATTQSIVVTESGDYQVTITGVCDDFASNPVSVNVIPIATPPSTENVEVLLGEDATLSATGENIRWYDAPVGGNLLSVEPELDVLNVTAPATYYVANSNAFLGFMEPHDYEGTNPFSGDNLNAEIYFNVPNDMVLKSVKVITDTPGERTIELRAADNSLLESQTVNIPSGESRATLNFRIPAGNNYRLTTNASTNLATLGTVSPRLNRSNQNVSFPYTISGVCQIIGASLGNNRYYYFYDWEVVSPVDDCESERLAVEVSIGTAVIDMNATDAVRIFPNPGKGLLQVDLEMISTHTVLTITDVMGRTMLTQNLGAVNGKIKRTIDASSFVPGTYMVQIQGDEEQYFGKLIIQ